MGPPTENGAQDGDSQVRFVALSYDSQDSEASALRIIHAVRAEWASDSHVEFVRFTDGITNTLLKAVNKKPGLSKDDIDKEAILLRAYGNGTDVLIDRQRETQNHELLMRHGLAPELLARFENGMVYRFIRGSVTQPEDLRRPEVFKAVARRLAEWHVTVPCLPGRTHIGASMNGRVNGHTNGSLQEAIDTVAPRKQAPNVWTVMQKWIFALPTDTGAQRERQASLQSELAKLVQELSQRPGLGTNGLVFAHTDLLSGNVIVLPKTSDDEDKAQQTSVAFIDYEYAVPSPAAFDIANHFAEWGGFDCDMSVLPTVSQRRAFIAEYAAAYAAHLPAARGDDKRAVAADALEAEEHAARLLAEVDLFRGVPGFYWGVWALIQARISQIDFDYASYAETRLGEYWAWRAEEDGSRRAKGEEMPLRERRWAQES